MSGVWTVTRKVPWIRDTKVPSRPGIRIILPGETSNSGKKNLLYELPHKNGTLIKKTGMKGMTI